MESHDCSMVLHVDYLILLNLQNFPFSAIWHFEESIILVLKKNGCLEWKALCNDPLPQQNGVIMVDQLLRLLVSEKLEFDCLNSINILAYQRNNLIIQTSTRQIVALELLPGSAASVSWAYSLSEFELFEVCDRCFLVFEPLSRQLCKSF